MVLLLQFCTYGQLLELKLLKLFCPAHCIFYCSFLHTVQINDDDDDDEISDGPAGQLAECRAKARS